MKFFVKVKASAKTECVEQVDSAHFVVAVKEPSKEGKANAAVIKSLARFFDTAPSRFQIVSGKTFKEKIIEFV
ncbi:MAG: DUF167 domain-containing protein [Candidatus Wildermuthbacteria bacterium]|nr:DUF167 domain-containing protein [Candidatus Wildermuthbacteria bacterium]